MPRIHKGHREGRFAKFTNESKFVNGSILLAEEAIREGDSLRSMLEGRRILEVPYGTGSRDSYFLLNSFRL